MRMSNPYPTTAPCKYCKEIIRWEAEVCPKCHGDLVTDYFLADLSKIPDLTYLHRPEDVSPRALIAAHAVGRRG